MKRRQVAVWGLGPHALKNVLPAFARAASVELAGVLSRDAQSVARASTRYGCRTWRSPAELLGDDAVDAVYVATPTGLHARHGAMVLEAGKDLWCEKPFTATLADTTRLVGESRRAGRVVGEAFMYLDHPQFQRLRDVVTSGRLGRVHGVTCRFGIPPLANPGFRTDPGLGGSALLDVGSYPVSAVTALFPGETRILLAEMYSAPGYGIDVGGRAVLRLADSIAANLEWRIDTSYRAEIDIWGDQGSVSAERIFSKPPGAVARLRFLDRTAGEHWEDAGPEDHFARMMDRFASLATETDAAERERRQIERRARVLDSIRRLSERRESHGEVEADPS